MTSGVWFKFKPLHSTAITFSNYIPLSSDGQSCFSIGLLWRKALTIHYSTGEISGRWGAEVKGLIYTVSSMIYFWSSFSPLRQGVIVPAPQPTPFADNATAYIHSSGVLTSSNLLLCHSHSQAEYSILIAGHTINILNTLG